MLVYSNTQKTKYTICQYIATISLNKYEYSPLVSVRLLFDPKWLLYFFHSMRRTSLLLTLSRSTWDHFRWLFYSGAHVAKYLLVLCSSILSPITLFVFCHFSFGHCIVCPSLRLLITPLLSSNFSYVLIGWCWSLLLTILRVTFPNYGAYFLYIFVYYPFVLDIKFSTPSQIFSPRELKDLIRSWFSLRTFSMIVAIFVSKGTQNMKPV